MAFFEKRHLKGPGDGPTEPDHPPSLAPTTLVIDPQALVHPHEPVGDLLYGGLLEQLGRVVIGGVVDNPQDPSPEALLEKQPGGRLGWRRDVKELLAKNGDLQTTILRWPGGNFASAYHWEDAVGPLEQRRRTVELAWKTEESNAFGTDEFIDYCRGLGIEPYICLNMGTGTLQEALAWVEYCNGKGNTHYANLRRKYGHEQPFNVKYWGLGNEVWGPWQVGFSGPTEYANRAKQWAHALKLLDPDIKLVLCGNTGSTEWDREVLAICINYVDLHSIHYYSQPRKDSKHSFEENAFGPAALERNIEICQSLIDLANIENEVLGIPSRPVRITVDEWNAWDLLKYPDLEKYPGDPGLEQPYDVEDLLGFCGLLNILVRKHHESPINCLALVVNALAPMVTRPDAILKQSIYHPFRLFSRYMKHGHLINLNPHPDKYLGPTNPDWIQQLQLRPSYVDGVAIVVEDGDQQSIRLSILNRHPAADWKLSLSLVEFEVESVEMHEMYHDNVRVYNTFENPDELVPVTSSFSAEQWSKKSPAMSIRKHSWCFFIIVGRKTRTQQLA